MVIVGYIDKWMRNRHTKFILNEDRVENRIVNKGLPQGVLSPTLYNIYTSNISKDIDRETTVLQYADDIVVYTIRETLASSRRHIENAINVLDNRLK